MSDVYVNLDRLKERAARWQDHIDAMEELIEDVRRGQMREAIRDGSKFGGFEQADTIYQRHRQLADETLWLLYKILGGLITAKAGVEQTIKNYHSVDDQRSREFAEIKKLLPE